MKRGEWSNSQGEMAPTGPCSKRTMQKIKHILVAILIIQVVLPLFIPAGLSLEVCVEEGGSLDIALVPCSPNGSVLIPESKTHTIDKRNGCEDFRVGCIEEGSCDFSYIAIPPRHATLLACNVALSGTPQNPITPAPLFAGYSSNHPSPHLTLLQTVNLLI